MGSDANLSRSERWQRTLDQATAVIDALCCLVESCTRLVDCTTALALAVVSLISVLALALR